MKRTRLVTASMVLLALTAAACGSSGPKSLSEDDFVSEMDSICRSADRAINKLDFEDSGYVDDLSDVIQGSLDDFAKLKAPKALQADFDDFTANLDDQLSQFVKLSKAIENDDTEAADKASDKLTSLSADGDDLADSIGAEKCIGVGGGGDVEGPVSTEDSISITTAAPEPTTAATEATTVATEATTVDTVTPNTPLPIDTTVDTEPVMTAPPSTAGSSSGGVVAGDASLGFAPIAGYTWGTVDTGSTVTPSDDPVLGPVLSGYYVGVMENAEGAVVYVYVTVLNDQAPWTPEQLTAYYNFEGVGDGQDGTLPTIGLAVRTKANAFDGFDAAVLTIDGVGVSLLAPTGSDAASLLEGFAIAQSAG